MKSPCYAWVKARFWRRCRASRLLRHIAKERGKSVLIVSHGVRIRDIADRVLWLEDGEFKEARTPANDPVCGRAVERGKAPQALWEGQNYSFCSNGCRQEFLANSQHFIGTPAKGGGA